MADERRALLAEQQASMEKLVSIISASVHRDVPLRMEEIVKAEVHSFSLLISSQNLHAALSFCHWA